MSFTTFCEFGIWEESLAGYLSVLFEFLPAYLS